MLKKIFLIRHAQSEEDVDPSIRNRVHDSRISVTSTGKSQVFELVNKLRSRLAIYKSVKIIASSTNRAQQTMRLFSSQIPEVDFEIKHEKCVRNLDWGDVNDQTIRSVEQERYSTGVLYFQFPNGDDSKRFVSDIELFVAGLLEKGQDDSHAECVVIFTHGFALRVIAKAILRISDDDFRYLANPTNCYVASFDIATNGIVLEEPLPKIKFKI